jgi:hypothetical protein
MAHRLFLLSDALQGCYTIERELGRGVARLALQLQ